MDCCRRCASSTRCYLRRRSSGLPTVTSAVGGPDDRFVFAGRIEQQRRRRRKCFSAEHGIDLPAALRRILREADRYSRGCGRCRSRRASEPPFSSASVFIVEVAEDSSEAPVAIQVLVILHAIGQPTLSAVPTFQRRCLSGPDGTPHSERSAGQPHARAFAQQFAGNPCLPRSTPDRPSCRCPRASENPAPCTSRRRLPS